MDDTASRELSPAEKRVFGEDAKLGPDGRPLEQGSGAPPQNAAHHAHAHAIHTMHLAEGLAESAKSLAAVAADLAKSAKDAVHARHRVVTDEPVVEPVVTTEVDDPEPRNIPARGNRFSDNKRRSVE